MRPFSKRDKSNELSTLNDVVVRREYGDRALACADGSRVAHSEGTPHAVGALRL